MKKSINLILALLFLTNWSFAQKNDCSRKTYFGEVEICLPKIEGYQECYYDSTVKWLADKTEMSSNMVLAFYLDDKTFQKKDSLGLFSLNNYFKIYGTKQIKDYQADTEILKQMQDILATNFISKNWDEIKKEVDKIGLDVEIGVPTVVESYNFNETSFTYLMLTKYEIDGAAPYMLAMSMNGVLINERLVWMAYYLNYDDEETMTDLRKKTNKILAKLSNTEK